MKKFTKFVNIIFLFVSLCFLQGCGAAIQYAPNFALAGIKMLSGHSSGTVIATEDGIRQTIDMNYVDVRGEDNPFTQMVVVEFKKTLWSTGWRHSPEKRELSGSVWISAKTGEFAVAEWRNYRGEVIATVQLQKIGKNPPNKVAYDLVLEIGNRQQEQRVARGW